MKHFGIKEIKSEKNVENRRRIDQDIQHSDEADNN